MIFDGTAKPIPENSPVAELIAVAIGYRNAWQVLDSKKISSYCRIKATAYRLPIL
jgi:hypothetical protein